MQDNTPRNKSAVYTNRVGNRLGQQSLRNAEAKRASVILGYIKRGIGK